jgi:copper chaperone
MITLEVPGMTCGHCARAITNALQAVDPEASVAIDLASKRVTVTSGANPDQLRAALQDAGYEVRAQSD